MKNLVVISGLLLISAHASAADTFESRKSEATRVERTQNGRAYWMQQLIPRLDEQGLQKLQGRCFVGGGEAKTTETYILVADISADGNFENVAVEPINERTSCVAEGFKTLQAPAPPREFHKNGFPIAIQTTQEY